MMDKQIPADAGVGAKGTKRSDETYREVGQAHGRPILARLLLADNPGWSMGRAWVEVDILMAPQEFKEPDLEELLRQSIRGKAPCRR